MLEYRKEPDLHLELCFWPPCQIKSNIHYIQNYTKLHIENMRKILTHIPELSIRLWSSYGVSITVRCGCLEKAT